ARRCMSPRIAAYVSLPASIADTCRISSVTERAVAALPACRRIISVFVSSANMAGSRRHCALWWTGPDPIERNRQDGTSFSRGVPVTGVEAVELTLQRCRPGKDGNISPDSPHASVKILSRLHGNIADLNEIGGAGPYIGHFLFHTEPGEH